MKVQCETTNEIDIYILNEQNIYLDESNVSSALTKALTAHVDAIFADDSALGC
jgi:hypothetical protein